MNDLLLSELNPVDQDSAGLGLGDTGEEKQGRPQQEATGYNTGLHGRVTLELVRVQSKA